LGTANLWLDEIHTIIRISRPFSVMLGDIEQTPFPPLYYIMLKLWTELFGTGAIALRLPSAIFSSLTILFIFKLSEEMYSKRVAFFSAILLSVSPYSINYAQDSKMYSLLWLFCVLSFLYLYRFANRYRIKDLILYAVFTVCALYTNYAGLLFVFIHNLFFFFAGGKKKIRLWLIAQAALFLAYLPWLNRLIYHAGHTREYLSWVDKVNESQTGIMTTLAWITGSMFGTKRWITQPDMYLYIILAVCSVIAWKNIRNKEGIFNFKKETGMLLAWTAIPLIALYLANLHIPRTSNVIRYIGFIHIPLIILISKGIDALDHKTGNYNLKPPLPVLPL